MRSLSQSEQISHSLDYINEQFKKFNSYNLQFSFDPEGKNLISRSVYFEVTYPISQLSSIYYTKRSENDCIIYFKCQNDNQCINSLNLDYKTTDTRSEYSFNLETTSEIAEKVVAEFIAIKNVINNPVSITESKPAVNNTDLTANIEYINKMLKKYNAFNIQFSIDSEKKIMQSRSEYFEITYYPSTLHTIDLITRGENDYKINFTCKLDVTCLTSVDLRNNKIELINNYPVNFTGTAEEAQKMINAFNLVLQGLGK